MTAPNDWKFGRGKIVAIDGDGKVVWSGECAGLKLRVETDKSAEMPVNVSRVASITIGDCDLIGLRRKLDGLREPRPPELERERKP